MTDEEYLNNKSTIEIYAEILLAFLQYTYVKDVYSNQENYEKELTKKLKFEKSTDYKLLRSCIDLLEDSECAIVDVYKYGLITNDEHFGEMYLRLYGVLNAFYLQLGAVIDLMRLFNLSDQKAKRIELKETKIIELRNKIGSHTTSYNIPASKNETDFFKLAQSSISKWGDNLLIVGKNSSENFNLIRDMKIFSLKTELILDEVTNKVLKTRRFRNEHYQWIKLRYDFIKNYR